MQKHIAVWIDHKEARVFDVLPEGFNEEILTAPQRLHHDRPRTAKADKEHPNDTRRFFHEVARSINGAGAILVVGPSTAKMEFTRYLHKNDHVLEGKVVGVETVDHPTGGQVVAYAREYFQKTDGKR